MEDVRPEVIRTKQPREKLEIFQSDGYWCASQGTPLEVGYREQRLAGSSTRLTSVVESIEEQFPGRYQILVSTSVTRNPFIKQYIKTSRNYGIALDFKLIQQALDHPATEVCTLCKGEAWYNGHVGHYECSKCGAHEVGGEFVKIRRKL